MLTIACSSDSAVVTVTPPSVVITRASHREAARGLTVLPSITLTASKYYGNGKAGGLGAGCVCIRCGFPVEMTVSGSTIGSGVLISLLMHRPAILISLLMHRPAICGSHV